MTMTKNELIENVRVLQATAGPHVRILAVSTLNSKTVDELQKMIADLQAPLTGEEQALADEADAKKVEVTGDPAPEPEPEPKPMGRKQLVAELRAQGYTGPVSYLVPRLREIMVEHNSSLIH